MNISRCDTFEPEVANFKRDNIHAAIPIVYVASKLFDDISSEDSSHFYLKVQQKMIPVNIIYFI